MRSRPISCIFVLLFTIIFLVGASKILKPAEISVKLTSSGDAVVTLKINEAAIRTAGTGTLERAAGSGAFEVIAVFTKPKKKMTFTDKLPAAEVLKYRTRIKYMKGKRKSFSATVVLDNSGDESNDTPTPAPTARATSTPTIIFEPTPVPTAAVSGYFDSSGNVTAAGKTAFGIPSSFSANKNTGASKWISSCKSCHGTSEKTNRSFSFLKSALPASPMFLNFPDQDVADLAAYLNRFKS